MNAQLYNNICDRNEENVRLIIDLANKREAKLEKREAKLEKKVAKLEAKLEKCKKKSKERKIELRLMRDDVDFVKLLRKAEVQEEVQEFGPTSEAVNNVEEDLFTFLVSGEYDREVQEREVQAQAAQERVVQAQAAQSQEKAAQEKAAQERVVQAQAAQEKAAQERVVQAQAAQAQEKVVQAQSQVAPKDTYKVASYKANSHEILAQKKVRVDCENCHGKYATSSMGPHMLVCKKKPLTLAAEKEKKDEEELLLKSNNNVRCKLCNTIVGKISLPKHEESNFCKNQKNHLCKTNIV